jgi:hypothetical protein
MSTAIERFTQLCDEVSNVHIDERQFRPEMLMNTIADYVHAIETSPQHRYEASQIRSAPDMINVRVYNYEPGTGKATQQFYKFAKAVTQYPDTFRTRLSSRIILSVLRNYLEDQME